MNDKVFMVGHQYCYNDVVQEFINKPLKEISLEHSVPFKKKKYFLGCHAAIRKKKIFIGMLHRIYFLS